MRQKDPPAGEVGNISLPIIIVVVIIIILLALGFWFWQKGFTGKQDLGSQIFKEIQNPSGDKIPETNPFAKLNPFKGVYKNPFE